MNRKTWMSVALAVTVTIGSMVWAADGGTRDATPAKEKTVLQKASTLVGHATGRIVARMIQIGTPEYCITCLFGPGDFSSSISAINGWIESERTYEWLGLHIRFCNGDVEVGPTTNTTRVYRVKVFSPLFK